MPSHVRGQDNTDESLPKSLEIVSGELFQEVVVLLVENCEGFRRVEVFLHTLITEKDGSVADSVHMVAICEAIMLEIVTDGSDAHREGI